MFEFKLPDIGEGLVEGEIVKWLVEKGDTVKEDQPIVEVMTDKATVEISSPRDGIIADILYGEGDVVAVEATFVIIDEGSATHISASVKEKQATPKPTEHEAKAVKSSMSNGHVGLSQRSEASALMMPPIPQHRVLATPAVRRVARQRGINLNSLQGSGPYGRILHSDLKTSVSDKQRSAAKSLAQEGYYQTRGGETHEIPLRALRKRIAEQMLRSKQSAPHFTYVEEVDMTALVELRHSLKPDMEKRNVKITYLPFVVKAVLPALKEFPQVNSSIDDDRGVVIEKKYYNLGIATGTDDGLMVPVLKNPESLDIFQIASEINRLVDEARQKKIKVQDLQDSTFTVTSIGNIGGVLATPILNYPEAGVMGINKIRQTPVVRDGQIVIRHMMYISSSFDHRIVDGDIAARFTNSVVKRLQSPKTLL